MTYVTLLIIGAFMVIKSVIFGSPDLFVRYDVNAALGVEAQYNNLSTDAKKKFRDSYKKIPGVIKAFPNLTLFGSFSEAQRINAALRCAGVEKPFVSGDIRSQYSSQDSSMLSLLEGLWRHSYAVGLLYDPSKACDKYGPVNFYDSTLERAINYARLYKFKSSEILIIDSDLEQIERAKKYGLRGILYRDINQLKRALHSMQVSFHISRPNRYSPKKCRVISDMTGTKVLRLPRVGGALAELRFFNCENLETPVSFQIEDGVGPQIYLRSTRPFFLNSRRAILRSDDVYLPKAYIAATIISEQLPRMKRDPEAKGQITIIPTAKDQSFLISTLRTVAR